MSFNLILFAVVLGLAVAYPSAKPDLAKPFKLRNKGVKSNGLGIYDGTTTTIEDHPYLVGILLDGNLYCGGVILSESWIITDGDCVYSITKKELTVVAGSSDGTTGTKYKVKKIVPHPDYDYSTYRYDYALIEIKGSFSWSSSVANISLPSSRLAAKTQVVVAGYGDTSSEDGTLLEGTMTYLANATCKKYYDDLFGWYESDLCAYNKGKVTVCNGDFGDPFVHNGVLYGVTLGGLSAYYCTSESYPTVMGDIYLVVDWIQEYTGAQIAQN